MSNIANKFYYDLSLPDFGFCQTCTDNLPSDSEETMIFHVEDDYCKQCEKCSNECKCEKVQTQHTIAVNDTVFEIPF